MEITREKCPHCGKNYLTVVYSESLKVYVHAYRRSLSGEVEVLESCFVGKAGDSVRLCPECGESYLQAQPVGGYWLYIHRFAFPVRGTSLELPLACMVEMKTHE